MSAPGFWEIITLAVLALLVFGPDKLPDLAHNVGKAIAQFKREANATLDELRAAAELEDIRDVADDVRGVTADLRKTASLTTSVTSAGGTSAAAAGAAATGAAAAAAQQASVTVPARREGPPPFDPDAT